jgi:hypothetical protein
MAALGMSILRPVDLLPGGEIDVRRVPLLGIHNGDTLSEFPGLDELTSARVLGRLLYAVANHGGLLRTYHTKYAYIMAHYAKDYKA